MQNIPGKWESCKTQGYLKTRGIELVIYSHLIIQHLITVDWSENFS